MKFIIVRVNDWVENIHRIAKSACLCRINQQNIQKVYSNLLNFIRLFEMKRYNHQEILDKVKQLLVKEENKDYLLKGIQESNLKIRKFSYLLLFEHKPLNHLKLVEHISKETDAHLRYTLVIELFTRLKKEQIVNVYKYFINDENSKIRSFLLYKLNEIDLVNLEEIVYSFIFDKSTSVRKYARLLLSKKNEYNYAVIYRNEILNNRNILGCISGLGEIGNKSDVSLILDNLNHNKVKIVKASLLAIANLDFDNNKDLY